MLSKKNLELLLVVSIVSIAACIPVDAYLQNTTIRTQTTTIDSSLHIETAVKSPMWQDNFTLYRDDVLQVSFPAPDPSDPDIEGNYYQILDNVSGVIEEANWTRDSGVNLFIGKYQLKLGYHNITFLFIGTHGYQKSHPRYLIKVEPAQSKGIPWEISIVLLTPLLLAAIVLIRKYGLPFHKK